MSPEAQVIALAEACGWQHRWVTIYDPIERGGFRLPNTFGPGLEAWWHPTDPEYPGVYGYPPNYLTNLNAMARAEDLVCAADDHIQTGDALRFRYSHELYNVVVPLNRQPFRATAAQRAEALLRALGKWTQ